MVAPNIGLQEEIGRSGAVSRPIVMTQGMDHHHPRQEMMTGEMRGSSLQAPCHGCPNMLAWGRDENMARLSGRTER